MSEIESTGTPDVSYVSGYGTGTLAAAAASCCTTPEQLLPIALETVLISFRVGLLAANTRDQIVIDRADQASWRVSIETDQTEVVVHQLEDFCTQKV